ncbi:hypothetical protein AB0G06_21475 [Nonomuraea dietziae]|uniref:hypothetical protein n=1 Tax=Nonomuraea dietziae TaxID=65515 RepID=UPI0033C6E164
MATSPRRPSRSTVVTTALTIGVFGAGAGLGSVLHDRASEPRTEVLRLAAGTYQLDGQSAESPSGGLTARSLTGADGGSTLSGGAAGPPVCLAATVDWLAVQATGEACASIPLLGNGTTTSPPLLRPGNPADRSTPSERPQEPKKSERPDPAPRRSEAPQPTRMNEPRQPAPRPPAQDPPAPTKRSEPDRERKPETGRDDDTIETGTPKLADAPATSFPKGTLRAVEPVPSRPPLQPVRPRPADESRSGQSGQDRARPTGSPPTASRPVQRPPRQSPPDQPRQNPPDQPRQNPPDQPRQNPSGQPRQSQPGQRPTVRPPDKAPTARPPGATPTVRPPDDRQCLLAGPDGSALRPAVREGIAPGCEDPAQTALPTARPAPPTLKTAPPVRSAQPSARASTRVSVKPKATPSQPSMPTSLRPAATGRPTQPRGTAAATSGPRAPEGTTLRPATVEGESLPIFQDPELMRRAEEALGLDGTRTYTDANGEWDLTIAPPGTPECRDYSKQQLQAMGVSAASPANLPRDSCMWPAFIRWLYAEPADGEVSNWTKFTGLPDRNLQLVVVDPTRGSAPSTDSSPGVVEPDPGP